MKEIERKFLIKTIPNLDNITPIRYERYFLSNNNDEEIRIQKKSDNYELESKIKISEIEYKKEKKLITEAEFLELKNGCKKSIIRDSYLINEKPNITIKKYYEDYEGLVRVEIEFESIEESNDFKIPLWVDREITGTELGNDSKLILLDRNQFLEMKSKIMKTAKYPNIAIPKHDISIPDKDESNDSKK